MCLATVYVEKDGQQEEVMRDVAWIRPQSGGLQLISFMGESRLFQAEVKSIDLVNGSIVLASMTTNSSQNGIQLEEESDGRNDPSYI
jgi:predicted RNA-binding protein